jgi:hypothetical protein
MSKPLASLDPAGGGARDFGLQKLTLYGRLSKLKIILPRGVNIRLFGWYDQ